MKENSSKNFSYVSGGRIIAAAILAIFYLIFAALLDPTDYGEMSYLIALAGTFSVVSRFGLPQTVIVYRAKGNMQLTNQINLLGLVTTSVASIILVFINEFSALLCLGTSLFFFYQHNLLGEKKYRGFMKNSVLRGAFIFVIPFPFYFVLGVQGVILGMGIATTISGLWLLKSISFKKISFGLIKEKYKVLLSNFGVDASSNLVRWIDRLVVGAAFGFLSLGFYHFNMQILFTLEILPRALYQFLLSEESSGKSHKKINYLVVLVSGLIIVSVIFIAPIIIEQFFSKYTDGIFSLQILATSLLPISISLIITAKMQAEESKSVGYSAIVRIGSLLILLSLLGNVYGLTGFSMAVLISTILNTIFLYFLYIRSKKNNM